MEILNGDLWPNTPIGINVVNKTCAAGRIGQKSRNCTQSQQWDIVYSMCINAELGKVASAATVSLALFVHSAVKSVESPSLVFYHC